MQANTTIPTDPATAVSLIQQWKTDSSLQSKYSSAGEFFTHAEWLADSDLRAEFNNDYESYAAFSRRA